MAARCARPPQSAAGFGVAAAAAAGAQLPGSARPELRSRAPRAPPRVAAVRRHGGARVPRSTWPPRLPVPASRWGRRSDAAVSRPPPGKMDAAALALPALEGAARPWQAPFLVGKEALVGSSSDPGRRPERVASLCPADSRTGTVRALCEGDATRGSQCSLGCRGAANSLCVLVPTATLTYDTLRFAEFEDFPETSEPVWILGRKYSLFTEKDEILSDVASRLWFTYRRNFPAIGGTGPTSDTGWGCMLRCGQMIFAQALVCRHLGRDWRWAQRKRQPDSYFSVLSAFLDRKDSYYSIHQIAQMGVGEGKSIGQWYGPNTVAQVLKHLLLMWPSALPTAPPSGQILAAICSCSSSTSSHSPPTTIPAGYRKLAVFDTWSSLAVHIAMDNTVVMEEIRRLCRASPPCAGAAALPTDSDGHCNGFAAGAEVTSRPSPWRPLVLLIPLRLGLTDINEAYVETLKHCFMMPQSLGVIGGKPNSAHYFIGCVGEELIYLDPHTTQPAVELTDSCFVPDESFHCQHPPCRMGIGELDPSIAVGFFCKSEDDFTDWCQRVRKLSLLGGALPMFELVEQQPSHLACPDVLNLSLDSSDVERLERFFDSEDEDFEILSL
ncbi:Cysteine protease ATG4B [Sciurus carolinensis]|uniref:Cysteine protease n=1 Tax=Sciurus carolinensis TaxID=30640 RepID=A0AA41T8T5_SCICA|nr:Cysteine protease ATG4B [Sciurus carolinensis]